MPNNSPLNDNDIADILEHLYGLDDLNNLNTGDRL
jgi:hypothetical protein